MYRFVCIISALLVLSSSQRILSLNRIRNPYNPFRSDDDYYGRYRSTSGQYVPDDSGRYVPDDSGRYVGTNERFDDRIRVATGKIPTPSKFGVISAISTRPKIVQVPGESGYRSDERNAAIVRFEKEQTGEGYHYLYQTENGITGEEQGSLVDTGSEGGFLRATGSYSYTGPDRNIYTVEYSADENGFVARGAHLPDTTLKAVRTV